MKICMLTRTTKYHHKGGMEDHIDILVNGLAKRGHEVHIITTEPREKIKSKNYHIVPGTIPGEYSKKWWDESSKEFFRLNNELKFDIVHSQSIGGISLLTRKNRKKLNIPVAISFHGTFLEELKTNVKLHKKNPLFGALLAANFLRKHFTRDFFKVRRADALIATSDQQAHSLEKQFMVWRGRIKTVYNGISVKKFTPYPARGKNILAAARFIRQKGIQNIIRAMPLIMKKHPDAKLVLVGDGAYRSELENLVKKLQIEKNVVFEGYIKYENLPKYFKHCAVFVNPTEQINGYDLTIVEAMACEKPVIVSDLGSVPTVVNNENGILVKPGNIEQLANAVAKLLSDRELAKRLGKQGRKDAISKFTDVKMIEDTIKIYHSLKD